MRAPSLRRHDPLRHPLSRRSRSQEKLLPVFPPCLLENPPNYRSAAVAWRRQQGAPQCAQIAPPQPPCQSLSACNRTSGPLGLARPSKAVTGASVRVHKSRPVSPCPCSFSSNQCVYCRSTARASPAAQPSNALPPPLPASPPAIPQSLVLPRKPLLPPKHRQPLLEQTVYSEKRRRNQ